MYAGLVDQTGQSVCEQVVAIDNGAASGAITIPLELEPGNYLIRAFTDFQKSIGEDAFFHKKIQISKLESFVESEDQISSRSTSQIDVAFLPEGGRLLEGQDNILGVKAIDTLGNGIPIQGEILDSKGSSVVNFTTSYKGMSSFHFAPGKGETYTVRLADHPEYSHTFENVLAKGIKIEFKNEDSNSLHFRVVTNAESLIDRIYYFAISHRGEVIFHKKFVPKDKAFPITVNRDALPAGISRMVLLDEQLLPLSERLYFSTNYQINEIKIRPDKQSYETRSRIRIRLSDGKEMDKNSWSNLSMAVVDEFASNKENPSMNILSYLLLDSELKGQIESPLDYFTNNQDMASAAKLDLLMMTQGWSRYIWNRPEEYLTEELLEDEGFDISGTVRKVVGNKPATDGSIELKVYNSDFMHMDEMDISEEGRFVFEDVSFMDSAYVFIQARNKKDKLTFRVSLDSLFNDFPLASLNYLPKDVSQVLKQAEVYQKQYDNLQALKEYTLKTGGFFLDEVTIVEHKRVPDDGHFRIYAKPTSSLQITERDITYKDIFDYLRGRFAGVQVDMNNNVTIRGPSSFGTSSALLILDGIPVGKEVYLSIPMNDIDRVEVLKNPAQTAIFGTRGGSGVVSVFTKKGGARDYSDKYIPGTIAEKLAGYSSSREFYTPKYTDENIRTERPDHRIVQFWEPNIFTEKGKATVSFFSSDDITRHKVYVEGITNEGKICLGTAEIVVDQRNDQLSNTGKVK